MALKPLQAQLPLGQFDGDDTVIGSLKGGEVVTFASTLMTSTDKAAKDAFDGYAVPATPKRPFVTRLGEQSTDGYARPLMLADEGIAGYGTLFGTVVGGTVGQVSTGGTVLGPHTTAGSGKITCYATPGLFAITIDTLASDVQPTTTIAVGAKLYATVTTGANAGLITATNTAGSLVGNFVDFQSNGSLVTTPSSIVGVFNAPDGALTASARSLTQAVIFFNPNSI